MTINLNISAEAIMHIKEIMRRRHIEGGFRLSMRKYGCNGYGYVPDVVVEPKENDIKLDIVDDFPVYIDPKYVDFLDGTTVDYVKKGLGQQLVFNNPNAEGECGCGESVNFKVQSNGE